MYYFAQNALMEPEEFHQKTRKAAVVEILSEEEAKERPVFQEKGLLEPSCQKGTRFCKLEVHGDYLFGIFNIPPKEKQAQPIHFSYLVYENHAVFVDGSGYVEAIFRKIEKGRQRELPGIGRVLADFLDMVTSGELAYLAQVEGQIAKLEDEVIDDKLEEFNQKIGFFRKKIMLHSHYYLRLADVGMALQENYKELFSKEELNCFRLFTERVNRLHEEALMLREYSTQVREVYQSQIDIRQNQIMKILTIVTTIFLPLSLIAGWYGMNFQGMPELEWKYGYPAVVALSLLVVLLCIWIFKRKKFW